MDWQLPTLRFKHIKDIKEKTGLDLTNLEEVAELDSVLMLAPVIGLLTPIPPQEFESSFYGESIQDGFDQLIEQLKDFLPHQKSQLLTLMLEKIQEEYQRLGSGNTG